MLLFPPPPIPRSVSCGLNVAPAHTSARHEAVRVWLESMSGGSTDFNKKGRQRPDLDSMLLPDCLLLFPLDACRNTCRGQCTHKHACCKAVAGPRVLFFRGQVNTSPFTSLPLLQSLIYLFFNSHTVVFQLKPEKKNMQHSLLCPAVKNVFWFFFFFPRRICYVSLELLRYSPAYMRSDGNGGSLRSFGFASRTCDMD